MYLLCSTRPFILHCIQHNLNAPVHHILVIVKFHHEHYYPFTYDRIDNAQNFTLDFEWCVINLAFAHILLYEMRNGFAMANVMDLNCDSDKHIQFPCSASYVV